MLPARADQGPAELARRLYDVVESAPIGEFFTHQRLSEIMGVDLKTTSIARTAILIVRRRLLKRTGRLFQNIRGKGYLIAQPDAHAPVASSYRIAGTRKISRGYEILVAVNVDALSDLTARNRHVMELTRTGMAKAFLGQVGRQPKVLMESAATMTIRPKLPSGMDLVRIFIRPVAEGNDGPATDPEPAPATDQEQPPAVNQ